MFLLLRANLNTSDVDALSRDLFDEIRAGLGNASMHRPAHDRWGIDKVALVHCDDFMLRVFEFPWWWQNKPGCRRASQTAHTCKDLVAYCW